MAGTTVNKKLTVPPNSDLYATIAAVNALIVDIELLRTAIDTIADQLDADGGVTGTTFAANAAVATAAVLTAAKVANEDGTAFS